VPVTVNSSERPDTDWLLDVVYVEAYIQDPVVQLDHTHRFQCLASATRAGRRARSPPYAKIPFTTSPWMSVRRKSRPW
jgi:hypothetical protein